jgi:hypothetical protein
MTPLVVDEAGLPNGWKDVRAGDAVVAFSRRSIYAAARVLLPLLLLLLFLFHSLAADAVFDSLSCCDCHCCCSFVLLIAMQAIENATGQRTCVVYGALPAETRRHQVCIGRIDGGRPVVWCKDIGVTVPVH